MCRFHTHTHTAGSASHVFVRTKECQGTGLGGASCTSYYHTILPLDADVKNDSRDPIGYYDIIKCYY